MADDSPLERFWPDPFARANPFLLLGAGPGDDSAQLASQAARRQLEAASQAEETTLRNAVRDLTADPIRRAAWEAFTPHLNAPEETTDAHERAARMLGEHLTGQEPDAAALPVLIRFAAHLGWDRRAGSLDAARVRVWWGYATHRRASSWEYWHTLALIYHREAIRADLALASAEERCCQGSVQRADGARSDALWLRALSCWSKTLAHAGFWPAICQHVQGMAGFRPERFELREEFGAGLCNALGMLTEDAARAGNRLAATRRRRLLATLTSHPETAEFHEAASDALERLYHRLAGSARKYASDGPRRFRELCDGLLLLYRDDIQAVTLALAAIKDSALAEETFEKDYTRAAEMTGELRHYVEVLARHVFADFPKAAPLSESASTEQKILLHWYYGLRKHASDLGPGRIHLSYLQELEAVFDQ